MRGNKGGDIQRRGKGGEGDMETLWQMIVVSLKMGMR